MACQGVRIRPDKFFKRPDLFSSHDLNPPIHTVLVVVPFPRQGDVGLGSQRGRPQWIQKECAPPNPCTPPCSARVAFLKHGYTLKAVILDLDSLLDA